MPIVSFDFFFFNKRELFACLILSYVPYPNVTWHVVISKIDPKKINSTPLMQKDSQVSTIKCKWRFWGNYSHYIQFHIVFFSVYTLKFVEGCAFLHPYQLNEYELYRLTQTLLRVKGISMNDCIRTTCTNWVCPGLIRIKCLSIPR